MGVGFYLMIAAAIVMYKIAEADKRRGWLWAGISLSVIMLLGRYIGLSVSAVFIGFFVTLFGMFVANMLSDSGRH